MSAPLLNLSLVTEAIADRPVVVLGSAPLAAPLTPRPEAALIAINGGISSGWRDPDVWVINARSRQIDHWVGARRRLHLVMVQQGAGRRVPVVVLLSREDGSAEATIARLQAQGTEFRHALDVNMTDRHEIECAAVSRRREAAKHALSAGLFAACLSLICTKRPVTLEGFSWRPGYQYATDMLIPQRGHETGDKFALHVLAQEQPGRVQHTLTVPANPLARTIPVRPRRRRELRMAKTPGVNHPGSPQGGDPAASTKPRPAPRRPPTRPAAARNAPLAPGPTPPATSAVPPTGQTPLRPKTLGGPTARVSTPEARHGAKLARTAAQAAGRPVLERASTPEAVAARHDALQEHYNESRGKVRAKKLLFYDMARRREGDVFVLREPTDFKASQMEWVNPATPEKTTTPREAAIARDRNIAGNPQPRRLAPNAADDAEDQDLRSPLD